MSLNQMFKVPAAGPVRKLHMSQLVPFGHWVRTGAEWDHIAVTWDDAVKIYVNGVLLVELTKPEEE